MDVDPAVHLELREVRPEVAQNEVPPRLGELLLDDRQRRRRRWSYDRTVRVVDGIAFGFAMTTSSGPMPNLQTATWWGTVLLLGDPATPTVNVTIPPAATLPCLEPH